MTYDYENCEDQSDDEVATKPEDLQRLYKVIECHAIFIFYIIRIVYD
jgi:hypothetical protein